ARRSRELAHAKAATDKRCNGEQRPGGRLQQPAEQKMERTLVRVELIAMHAHSEQPLFGTEALNVDAAAVSIRRRVVTVLTERPPLVGLEERREPRMLVGMERYPDLLASSKRRPIRPDEVLP